MFRRLIARQPNLMLALVALTLVLRVIVPGGFMPTTDADGMVRIAMCSGTGPQTAWLDKSGQVHKEAPGKNQHDPQPCGFGALAQGADVPDAARVAELAPSGAEEPVPARFTVTIGRGLAAPPPPSTGPPILI